MNKLNYNETGTLITDEVIYGSTTAQKLAHDNFFNLEIWTGKGKTGTQLVEGTDYTLGDYDASYQAYNSISFDAAYDGVKLYATYYTKGDYVDAEDVNVLQGAGYFEGSKETEFNGVNILTINNDSAPCEAEYEIYPITIVNLLGKYGNFETDSNDDGVADGWEPENGQNFSLSTSNFIYGGSSQYLETKDAGLYHDVNITFPIKLDHKYFMSYWSKPSTTDYLCGGFLLKTLDNALRETSNVSWSDEWGQVKRAFTAPQDDTAHLYLYAGYNTTVVGNSCYFDGVLIVDLTEMGELPPPLKEFFDDQVSKWEDLATTANITAIDGRTQTGEDWLAELLPYVDSVATLGYTYIDGQLNVTVENRGTNLMKYDFEGYTGTPSYMIKKDGFFLSASSDIPGIREWVYLTPGTYVISFSYQATGLFYFAFRDAQGYALVSLDYNGGSGTVAKQILVGSSGLYQIRFAVSRHNAVEVGKLKLEEGSSASEYTPPRESKIEFATPLFNVRGTTDVLKTNGFLIKRTGYREILGTDSDWAVFQTANVVEGADTWAYIEFDTQYINPVKNQRLYFINYNGEILPMDSDKTSNDTITYQTIAISGLNTFAVKVILGGSSPAGWPDTSVNTVDNWKRFFNGWKYVDGTTWTGIGSSTATADATTSLTSTVLDIDPNANWHPITVIYQQGYKEDVDPTNGPFMGDPMEEYVPVDITGNLVLYNGTNYILAPQMALKVSKGRKLEYNDVVDKNFTT